MSEYDNTNRGILSRNDGKRSDNHPDFRGQLNVEGQEYWLSAWVKERKDGTGKFFSISVRPKESQRAAAAPAPVGGIADMTDDIPF